jgi:hypothetical protein
LVFDNDLLRDLAREKFRGSAKTRGEDEYRTRALGSPIVVRNERKRPLVRAGSGEEFHRPGGAICSGEKGEKERRGSDICRRGTVLKRQEIKRGERNSAARLRRESRTGEEESVGADVWGPHISKMRGWGCVPFQRKKEDGPWACFSARPNRFPSAFLYFFLSFFFFFSVFLSLL